MPLPIPTDEQIKADCLDILASHERYDWSRHLTVDGHLWGDWLDAAATALDCGDYSEIRWMRDLPDDRAETYADYADHMNDRRLDDRLVAQYEARVTYGMAVS